MEPWREELYHHGIKGQKWGVQNGPPYPLDESQYSKKEQKHVREINKLGKYMLDEAVDRGIKNVYHKRYGDSSQPMRYDAVNKEVRYDPKYLDLLSDFLQSETYKSLKNSAYDTAYKMVKEHKEKEREMYEKDIKAALGAGLGILGVSAVAGAISGVIHKFS